MENVTDSHEFLDNISPVDNNEMKTSSQQHLQTQHPKLKRHFAHQWRTKTMGSLAKRKVKRKLWKTKLVVSLGKESAKRP